MNGFLSKIVDSFKSHCINHVFNEDSEKNQNCGISSSVDKPSSIWYIHSNKHSKYPPLPEFICDGKCKRFSNPTHGRYSSNHSRSCYGSHCYAGGIQFFIEEERKHYRLLNTYVFEPLSQISLYHLTEFYLNIDDDVIPHRRMPTFYHFADAELHMKRDRGSLNELVESLDRLVNEFNTNSENANTRINQEIIYGIHRAGFDENNQTQIHDVNDINRLVRRILTRDIYTAPVHEMYDKARKYDASLKAEGLQETTRCTILDLVKNENIIELIWASKNLVTGLEAITMEINQQAIPISRAIDDEYYDTRVDCCPTYWTLLKRFV